VLTILVLVATTVASAAETLTHRVVFEGLDCGQERPQVLVRALAAAQGLGYETSNVNRERGTFKGRLKTSDRDIRLTVEVTCTDGALAGDPIGAKFFPPSRIVAKAEFRARSGGRAAAQADGERFGAEVVKMMQGRIPPPSCLGVSARDVEGLDREVRGALGLSSGVFIVDVSDGGPAVAAGLATGEVVLGIDGSETPNIGKLWQLLHQREPGDRVSLLIGRSGSQYRTALRLGRRTGTGDCLAVAGSAAAPSVPPSPRPDRLELRDIAVRPRPVSPGQAFDVELTIDLQVASGGSGAVPVSLSVEIVRDGQTVYRSSPETVSCTNGAVTKMVKHLRAARKPGAYLLRLTVEHVPLQDARTASLEIR